MAGTALSATAKVGVSAVRAGAGLASRATTSLVRAGTSIGARGGSKVLSSAVPKAGFGSVVAKGGTAGSKVLSGVDDVAEVGASSLAKGGSRFRPTLGGVATGVSTLSAVGTLGYTLFRDVETFDPNLLNQLNNNFSPGDIIKLLESLPQQVEQDFSWLENILGTLGTDAEKVLSSGYSDIKTIGGDVVWGAEEAFKFAPMILGGIALVMLFGFLR